MKNTKKQLSSPFSTGGGGVYFESHVQAIFVVLMLTEGYAPGLSGWAIYQIKLQGKIDGYETDDLIIYTKKPNSEKERKILIQIKHSISITNNKIFYEVIAAAWNDFNNINLFNKGKDNDMIALVTGHLSSTDNNVRDILELARHCTDAEDFYKKIGTSRLYSQKKREKLITFEKALKAANNGIEVSKDKIFEFLQHFHLLGYDLDLKAGVTLSLVHSHLNQTSKENVTSLWAKIVGEVQSANPYSGIISRDTLPEELLSQFNQNQESIPAEALNIISPIQLTLESYTDLAIANLIGAWNENIEADKLIIEQISGYAYNDWIKKVRELIQINNNYLSLKNGIWRFIKREEMWAKLGDYIYDTNLDALRNCATGIMREYDPKFDQPPEQRLFASFNSIIPKYSHELKRGIAESLALLGNNYKDLNHCSFDKRKYTAGLVINEIFKNADSKIWGSLNEFLPILAEAAPISFIEAVETSLYKQSPCPFDELFVQEGKGAFGENYLTGLLWALETLAWESELLVRITLILGELSYRDPGGNWSNRPFNSLATIFLPWLPQTLATIDIRKTAIATLVKKQPDISWKLLINMLPEHRQTSTRTRKPHWRKKIFPKDWNKNVTQIEYWEQVTAYSEFLISIATKDINKLNELIKHLNNLPQETLNKILNHLSSPEITTQPEIIRSQIWNALLDLVSLHKRCADAKWAFKPETIANIESIAKLIEPTKAIYVYYRFFNYNEFELYIEVNKNTENNLLTLETIRKQGIKKIYEEEGINGVIKFTESIKLPHTVGYSLAYLDLEQIDADILPKFIEATNKNYLQFIKSYIIVRYNNHGWAWCEHLNITSWKLSHITRFLTYLPFNEEIWNKVTLLLHTNERMYWDSFTPDSIGYSTNINFDYAIDKFINFENLSIAINLLVFQIFHSKPLNINLSIKALKTVPTLVNPPSINHHNLIKIIQTLQNNLDFNSEELIQIEWLYLPLLNGHQGVFSQSLEYKLATEPEFFCEIISLAYKSNQEMMPEKKINNKDEAIATNAFNLLYNWRIPPGYKPNRDFSGELFSSWFESVKQLSAQSGHFNVAMYNIGQVLIYCPTDQDGFFINRTVAEILDHNDAEELRNGFFYAKLNSRGVQEIDLTGTSEKNIGNKYRQLAHQAEEANYSNLANTFRKLSDYYFDEAENKVNY